MATFLATLFLVVCILLIIVVLLQKGRGGGLGAALGGGAGQSAFGTRTGDVFTWVTIVLTSLFLLLAIFTTFAYRPPAEAVAMPVFEPAAWPANNPKEVGVTMTSQGDAKIFYTTDGSIPDEKSPQYSKDVVRVTEGTVLKALALRHSRKSDVKTVEYSRVKPQALTPTTAEALTPTSMPASVPAAK